MPSQPITDSGMNEVQDFYDDFLESRMLSYRLKGGNARLERAIERITSVLRPGESLLDLGCGIGLVAEQVAERMDHRLRCWACDLSPRNIWYARETVTSPAITFFVADVVANFDAVTDTVQQVDVVTLVDVIEHIPVAHHDELFRNIARVTRAGSRIVLTYPSPLYQEHLRRENPAGLQIIDEDVDFDALSGAAAAHGFLLKHFSLEDVWMRNQYVHVVFERGIALEPLRNERGTIDRVRARLQRILDRSIRMRYRKWKYVTRVFDEQRRTR